MYRCVSCFAEVWFSYPVLPNNISRHRMCLRQRTGLRLLRLAQTSDRNKKTASCAYNMISTNISECANVCICLRNTHLKHDLVWAIMTSSSISKPYVMLNGNSSIYKPYAMFTNPMLCSTLALEDWNCYQCCGFSSKTKGFFDGVTCFANTNNGLLMVLITKHM